MQSARSRSVILCGMILALALVPGALAQTPKVKLPDTPAAKRLGEFLEMVGTRDAAKWRKFATEGYAKSFLEKRSVDDVVGMLQNMHEREGGFEVVKIEKSEPHTISVQARNKEEGRMFWLDIAVEPKEPFGIVGVGIDTAPPGSRPKTPGKVVVRQ